MRKIKIAIFALAFIFSNGTISAQNISINDDSQTSNVLASGGTTQTVYYVGNGGIWDNWDIYSYNLFDSTETRLTFNPAIDNHPVISHFDTTIVAFSSNRDGEEFDIYVADIMDIDGTAFRLTFNDDYPDRHPHWHPDGDHIIYTSKDRPVLVTVTQQATECSQPIILHVIRYFEGLNLIDINIPGVVVPLDIVSAWDQVADPGIWVLGDTTYVGHPSFNEEGDLIVFTAAIDGQGKNWEVYTMGFDTITNSLIANSLNRVTFGPNLPGIGNTIKMTGGASFSHDNTEIILNSTRLTGNSQIFSVPAGASDLMLDITYQRTFHLGNDYVPEPINDHDILISSDLGPAPICSSFGLDGATDDLDVVLLEGFSERRIIGNDTAQQTLLIADEVSWFCGLKPNISTCTFQARIMCVEALWLEANSFALLPPDLLAGYGIDYNSNAQEMYQTGWDNLSNYLSNINPGMLNQIIIDINNLGIGFPGWGDPGLLSDWLNDTELLRKKKYVVPVIMYETGLGAPPSIQNDPCVNAIPIACGQTISGSTNDASNSAIADCNGFANTASDVWYLFTGTGQMVSADLCSNPNYDTRISVFEGTCEVLSCIVANDDYCSLQSRIDWFAQLGTEYLIMVHGYSASTGTFRLTMDCISPPSANWLGGDVSFGDPFAPNDWFGPDNWDVGDVPGSLTDVTIPGGVSDFPTIDGMARCNSIFVESGGSLLDNGLLTAPTGITAERDYLGNFWHLISSPVTGETASTFVGLYLQAHDEPSNSYSDVTGLTTVLEPGQGFALWDPIDGTASYNGSMTFSATRALTRSAIGFNNGWNLVGNPFPSSIDWESTGLTKTNIDAPTYCFDGAGSGNWAIWNGIVGTNGATQYIASGQGFFVAVNDAQTTGTLGFNNGARVHHNTAFFKEEPSDIVKVKVSGNGYSDEIIIYFRDDASTGFDGKMDAHSLPSLIDNAPYIYSTGNDNLAINVLPEVVPVPVNVKVGTGMGTFTVETVSNGGFDELFLEDDVTGIIADLNENPYIFDYIQDIDSRFVLHFGPLGIDDNTTGLSTIYSFEKDVYVVVPKGTKGIVAVYDVMGKIIVREAIDSPKTVVRLEKSGYYVVKVQSNENITTDQVFIK